MIPLIKSTFYKEAQTKRELVNFIKKAKILSFSKECEKFEKGFARFQGRKTCVMVNSGSSANLALIQALLNMGMIKAGDKVGFSELTWSTNAMPLIQLGLKPVPVDVELETLNVSSKTLSKVLVREKIKLMFLTNLLGFCSDPEKIAEICKREKIILVEDNCEALGTKYKGRNLGNFGLASTFSFYVGHHLSTIEGGAVCTDSDELATQLSVVRAHGWDRNLNSRNQKMFRNKFNVNSTFYSRYTFYDLGFNLRPTEISGFIGNVQLKYIREIVGKRKDNFAKLSNLLYSDQRFYPIKYDHLDLVSNFAVPVICKSQKTRDELVKKCDKRLEIRPIVGGAMTMQPFFQKYVGKKFSSNTNAKLIHENGFYFGNNPELTKKEISEILKILS